MRPWWALLLVPPSESQASPAPQPSNARRFSPRHRLPTCCPSNEALSPHLSYNGLVFGANDGPGPGRRRPTGRAAFAGIVLPRLCVGRFEGRCRGWRRARRSACGSRRRPRPCAGRMVGGGLFQEGAAGRGVLDAGRGDQDCQQEAEGVGDDAALAAYDLLARVDALTSRGDTGGGLDALCVDHAGGRGGAAAFLLSHQLPQQAVELGEDTVLLPPGEVAVDTLVRREVVREVGPLAAGAVHVQDRVHDLAQVVPRRPAEVQGPAAALAASGGQHRLDQLPAGVGQVTRIRTAVRHDLGIPPPGGVRPGVHPAVSKHGTDPGVLERDRRKQTSTPSATPPVSPGRTASMDSPAPHREAEQTNARASHSG